MYCRYTLTYNEYGSLHTNAVLLHQRMVLILMAATGHKFERYKGCSQFHKHLRDTPYIASAL